ncbi:MACPF domain-containing protein NSL1 [Platanthera guangdongensis]|uniref:MACPF domain-containing protein NSL1 n=1 Tax=Platanthera guangdongensis TaxID=2320717 RepID=A0ABR2N380_9ASPA
MLGGVEGEKRGARGGSKGSGVDWVRLRPGRRSAARTLQDGAVRIALDRNSIEEDIVLPGGVAVHGVPKFIRWDKGERTRFPLRSSLVSRGPPSSQRPEVIDLAKGASNLLGESGEGSPDPMGQLIAMAIHGESASSSGKNQAFRSYFWSPNVGDISVFISCILSSNLAIGNETLKWYIRLLFPHHPHDDRSKFSRNSLDGRKRSSASFSLKMLNPLPLGLYKPPVEELHQFLEFQLPRHWASTFGDLSLGPVRRICGLPSLQFTLMGPKLYVNSTHVIHLFTVHLVVI